jgi:hypothetical protein
MSVLFRSESISVNPGIRKSVGQWWLNKHVTSSGESLPGFFNMLSGTPIFPISCSRAAVSMSVASGPDILSWTSV